MFQRVNISGKLMMGFGVIIVLLIASTLIISSSLMQVYTITDSMSEGAKTSEEANNILTHTLESRLFFNRVIINGSEEDHASSIKNIKDAIDIADHMIANSKVQENSDKLVVLQGNLKNLDVMTSQCLDYYIGQCKTSEQQKGLLKTIGENTIKLNLFEGTNADENASHAANSFIGEFNLTHDLELQRQLVKSLLEKLDAYRDEIAKMMASQTDDAKLTLLKTTLGQINAYKESVQASMDFAEKIETLGKEREPIAFECVEVADDIASHNNELVTANNDIMNSLIMRTISIIAAISLVTFITTVIIGLWLRNSVAKALSRIVGVMRKVINEGDISVDVDERFLQRNDEIGEIANAIEGVLKDYRSVTDLGQAAISGDWTRQVHIKSDKDVMNKNLAAMLDQINAVLNRVTSTSSEVLNGARQVASVSESLSQGATETAASLEEITTSMSEMGTQTQKNADNATEANSLSRMASSSAENGQQMMQQMIESMAQITTNSKEVQRVVKVIDDIAFQTNLLALNAAVEAARAGVHGKGFAVVAEEVRNLAARCAKAAKETTQMIENNNRQINDGGKIANKTAEMLNEIVTNVKQTGELIGDIADASKEQASGINQVSQALQQIDTVTQRNTATAEETASASNEMQSHAAELMQIMSQFKLHKENSSKKTDAKHFDGYGSDRQLAETAKR